MKNWLVCLGFSHLVIIIESPAVKIITKYKFGVIYCKAGQTTEMEWLGNDDASEGFSEFLSLLGEKVPLKNWRHYNAGLDTLNDSAGTHSIYTRFEGYEVMFHVSTMLDHSAESEQQVGKKRHIGNDIVVILFKEGDEPIIPAFRSQYNHIFVVVADAGDGNYAISVARKTGVDLFGPPIPTPPLIPKNLLREFLLYKCKLSC